MKKKDIIEETGAAIEGHFVYKSRFSHGPGYVNKEEFDSLGSIKLCQMIRQVVQKAVREGLAFEGKKEIGVIVPAYGAIPFSLPVAEELERNFPEIKFFVARTELKEVNGEKIHYLPEKLISKYYGKDFILFDDIVNNGTTVREVSALFRNKANANVDTVLSFVNRGGQTPETLTIYNHYPLKNMVMAQHDLRSKSCPLCDAGIPINTALGKGGEWVAMFGQPPYPPGKDFSAFWE